MSDNPETGRTALFERESTPPSAIPEIPPRPERVLPTASPYTAPPALAVQRQPVFELTPALPSIERFLAGHQPWRGYAAFQFKVQTHRRQLADELFCRREFLGLLMASRADATIQLRISASPDGTLDVMLVCAVGGTTAANCRTAAMDLATSVQVHAHALAPTFALLPITDRLALRSLLKSGRRLVFAEVRRAEQTAHLPAGDFSIPRDATIFSTSFGHVCTTMLSEAKRLGRAIAYFVTVESAPDAHLVVDALGEEMPPSDQRVIMPRRLGPALRVQAFAAAAGATVPAAVLSSLRSEHADMGRITYTGMPFDAVHVARPKERKAVWDAITQLRVVDWEAASHPQTPGRLSAQVEGDDADSSRLGAAVRHLMDFTQACALFSLPLDPFPGLAVAPAPYRERWLDGQAVSGPGLTLGDNVSGHRTQPIRIGQDDLRRHVWMGGKSGTGKSTLMENQIAEAMAGGHGVIVLDPHGDLAEKVLALVPVARADDVIYFNPAEAEFPVSFNLLECTEDSRSLVVANFIGILQEIYDPHHTGIVGPIFQHTVRNIAMTALEAVPHATLLEVVHLLTSPSYVHSMLARVQDPLVKSYWIDQIAATTDFHKSEHLGYLVSKFSAFTHDARLRRVIGQGQSAFTLSDVMDSGRILICSLPQGLIGRTTSRFLGMTLVSQLLDAALSRARMPESERRDCYVFVDEFQDFATPSFQPFLSGARKQHVALVLANQHTAQLSSDLRAAIFGNVGTMISFKVGVQDAPHIAAAMQPSSVTAEDLMALPNFTAVALSTRDGVSTAPFTVRTRPAPEPASGNAGWGDTVRRAAQQRHGTPRELADKLVASRYSTPGRSQKDHPFE